MFLSEPCPNESDSGLLRLWEEQRQQVRQYFSDLQGESMEVDESPQPAEPPSGLGDDEELNDLAEECASEDFSACDLLYYSAPPGSEYQRYGDECGGRNLGGGLCSVMYLQDVPAPRTPATAV